MKSKSVTLFCGVIIVLSLALNTSALADDYLKTNVLVNGSQLSSEAKVIDDRVYVPIRAVGEAMGAKISWDESSRTATITSNAIDEIVPEIIKSVSQSTVGIIGTLKDDYSNESKYIDQFVHGSGVIIKSDGQILTNAHVVKDMGKIVVVLTDGSGYEGQVECIDEESDLATIRINETNLPAASFGNEEDIITGKSVIAIGTPLSFSLRNSASIGIISGLNRSINSSYRLIQTDAAINPGNSGGPLVNLQGKVIGINSSKYMGTGIEGMGFSIPLQTIRYVLKQFELNGKVIRPYLGSEFEEGWAARIGLPSNEGLTIVSIDKNSPAEKQGLMIDDTILAINDSKVHSIVDYNEVAKMYVPGDKVTIKFSRNNIIQSMVVEFGKE